VTTFSHHHHHPHLVLVVILLVEVDGLAKMMMTGRVV
jgi:hypothetical protein